MGHSKFKLAENSEVPQNTNDFLILLRDALRGIAIVILPVCLLRSSALTK